MADAVVNNVDEKPRASTSKEGSEPRVSMGTTLRQDSVLLGENQPVMVAPGLRRDIAAPLSTPSGDGTNNLGYTSSLSKLQT